MHYLVDQLQRVTLLKKGIPYIRKAIVKDGYQFDDRYLDIDTVDGYQFHTSHVKEQEELTLTLTRYKDPVPDHPPIRFDLTHFTYTHDGDVKAPIKNILSVFDKVSEDDLASYTSRLYELIKHTLVDKITQGMNHHLEKPRDKDYLTFLINLFKNPNGISYHLPNGAYERILIEKEHIRILNSHINNSRRFPLTEEYLHMAYDHTTPVERFDLSAQSFRLKVPSKYNEAIRKVARLLPLYQVLSQSITIPGGLFYHYNPNNIRLMIQHYLSGRPIVDKKLEVIIDDTIKSDPFLSFIHESAMDYQRPMEYRCYLSDKYYFTVKEDETTVPMVTLYRIKDHYLVKQYNPVELIEIDDKIILSRVLNDVHHETGIEEALMIEKLVTYLTYFSPAIKEGHIPCVDGHHPFYLLVYWYAYTQHI